MDLRSKICYCQRHKTTAAQNKAAGNIAKYRCDTWCVGGATQTTLATTSKGTSVNFLTCEYTCDAVLERGDDGIFAIVAQRQCGLCDNTPIYWGVLVTFCTPGLQIAVKRDLTSNDTQWVGVKPIVYETARQDFNDTADVPGLVGYSFAAEHIVCSHLASL